MSAHDEVSEAFWDATRERRLVLQSCRACDHRQHYPRLLCTSCGNTELEFAPISGLGVVDSFTVVHRAPTPGMEPPYVVARVRLAEGPILLTNLIGDADWVCDMPVRVDWRPLPDGRHLPVFRPMED
ncbi:Zn-ribbon domain-containing OB-fold protein [Streptosporangium sp. CA-115845]|uniref:Zn-ribbon domain-containing OB-fold protein n=1 Tax=Streptosporangium sp. CA-115845 TaxID=3240071 RepID=UPI003D8AFCA5